MEGVMGAGGELCLEKRYKAADLTLLIYKLISSKYEATA